ncbi:MAG: hypothetical protein L0323_22835 [Planctomycetes bacterium]|nr:hypothetical protein [Planctomycetota bacterium]
MRKNAAYAGLSTALALVLGGPFLAGTALAQGGPATRPLSDWLAGQGSTSVFFPPAPDILGWSNTEDPPPTPLRFALVDYAGVFADYILANGGPDLGTTVSGTVTEQELPDGRARVRVRVQATNALVWCTDLLDPLGNFPGATLFGASPADVLAGANASVGTCSLGLVFINTAPGATLPDLVQVTGNLPGAPPGVEFESIQFSASAIGELRAAFGVPDGTPGMFHTSQFGNVTTPPTGPTPDAFPVETMLLQPLGG